MPKASDLLKIMAAFEGYREGRSQSLFGRRYGIRHRTPIFSGAKWCDMFLAECALLAGGTDMLKIVGDFAFTPSHANWFKENERWHKGATGIRAGDVVFFDFPDSEPGIQHVGVVEKVRSGTTIQTIEGNTSNVVARRSRNLRHVVGYGRPAYNGTSSPSRVPSFPNSATAGIIGELDVRSVQELLIQHGFSVGPDGADGDFGPNTRRALRKFQHAHNLPETDLPDDKTWQELWLAW
ncbi:hypothetical protein GCM10009555_104250 [Acrocarpospora macrocephala]|uniref:Peptidase C51 domain-containing protein n=1 Tax=Acrocarpospora macrocephala TaxID=150177 RepID=A0A5M3WXN1_9ACTN|nr:peptidoglycan-binding protein [Acrocarpospora macrocephala]GES12679.1 hypothetical protein Amac_062760 [Acrocarpospora macrocephala]